MKTEPPTPGKIATAWQNRAVLIGIFVLFFVPVLAALWLNIYAPAWQPFGYVNRGDLVVPAVPIPITALKVLDGRPLAADYLTDRWTLVLVLEGPCESICEKALQRIRQVRLALGKDRDRVQRLLIATGNSNRARQQFAMLLEQFPGLRIASVTADSPFGTLARGAAGAVMLIDPQSFLMMRFPAALPAASVLKDMQRLLKLSKRD